MSYNSSYVNLNNKLVKSRPQKQAENAKKGLFMKKVYTYQCKKCTHCNGYKRNKRGAVTGSAMPGYVSGYDISHDDWWHCKLHNTFSSGDRRLADHQPPCKDFAAKLHEQDVCRELLKQHRAKP